MARKPVKGRRPTKEEIKAKAARAEARSKGKPEIKAKAPIDPEITSAETLRRIGRPSSYSPEYPEMAKAACMRGATDSEIAKMFGVTRQTIYRWKIEHEEFCYALIVGKEIADDRVERSLYEKAVGYEIEVEKVFQYQGEIVRATVVEHVQPDKPSIDMWLASRRTDKWRKTERIEHTGKDGGPIETTDTLSLARWIAYQLTAAEADVDGDGDAVH